MHRLWTQHAFQLARATQWWLKRQRLPDACARRWHSGQVTLLPWRNRCALHLPYHFPGCPTPLVSAISHLPSLWEQSSLFRQRERGEVPRERKGEDLSSLLQAVAAHCKRHDDRSLLTSTPQIALSAFKTCHSAITLGFPPHPPDCSGMSCGWQPDPEKLLP